MRFKKSVILLIIVFFTFGSITNSASISLPDVGLTPDSPFYFVKIWKESIQGFFTFDSKNKAEQLVHLAGVRLAEYQKMVEIGKFDIAEKTLNKFQSQLDSAKEKVSILAQKGENIQDLTQKIQETASTSLKIFKDSLFKIPEPAQKVVEGAIDSTNKAVEKIGNIKASSELSKKMEEVLGKLSPEQAELLKKIQEGGYQSLQGEDFQKFIDESAKLSNPQELLNSPEKLQEYMKMFSGAMSPFYKKIAPLFIKETPATSETTANEEINENGMDAGSGMGMGGGSSLEEQFRESERQNAIQAKIYEEEIKNLSNDERVEYTALIQYAGQLYAKEGMYSQNAKKVMDKINLIKEQNNISDGTAEMIASAVITDPILGPQTEKRLNELLAEGLK